MAGGRPNPTPLDAIAATAAMEPRPDGRGKAEGGPAFWTQIKAPQWSPGLMAGGSCWKRWRSACSTSCRNGAPACWPGEG